MKIPVLHKLFLDGLGSVLFDAEMTMKVNSEYFCYSVFSQNLFTSLPLRSRRDWGQRAGAQLLVERVPKANLLL